MFGTQLWQSACRATKVQSKSGRLVEAKHCTTIVHTGQRYTKLCYGHDDSQLDVTLTCLQWVYRVYDCWRASLRVQAASSKDLAYTDI